MLWPKREGWAQIVALLCCIGFWSHIVNAQVRACEASTPFAFGASEILNGLDDVLLRGNAWLCVNGTLLTAGEVLFDRRTEQGTAYGQVFIRDPRGNELRADIFDFGSEFNRALLLIRPDR